MRILITDGLAKEAVELLKKEHEVVMHEATPEELLKMVGDFEAVIVRSRSKITREVIEAGKKLVVLGRAGIGVDNIDVPFAAGKGIKVVNAPLGATLSVAELAIGHMLSLARALPYGDRETKAGNWPKNAMKGAEISGKVLGLIGGGNIAKATAGMAKNGFGMKILAYDPYLTAEQVAAFGGKKVELDELCRSADYISLHIPKTPETKHIINAERLAMMKPSARIINCARGGTIDENALYDALKEGKIAGAALDVFESEPCKASPLFELPNIFATPHIGANTSEGQKRAGITTAEQVLIALAGEEPEFWVNRPKN
ncbi:MAG: phosphoglycerate dehydrogenase [Thermoplasmata archaeon HGW-Thermoplasmata-1]|nr:MAG: phosphoglycerate dehydrogenase [Thermoplasmata archaeon HGW-Thermoplasmata-1]